MSNAICTGLTSSGNSFSDAKSSTLSPAPIVIFWIASVPSRKTWAPFGPVPGSFVSALMSGGVSLSSTFGSDVLSPDALAIAQTRRSRFARHHVQHRRFALQHLVVGREDVLLRHRADLLQAHVAWIPADEGEKGAVAIGRKPVGDPVAAEPVKILVDDRLPQRREVGRRVGLRRTEQLPVDHLRQQPVALGVQVDPVDGQWRVGRCVQLRGGLEQIDKRDPCGGRRPPTSPGCTAQSVDCSPSRLADRECSDPRGRSARTARSAAPIFRCTSARRVWRIHSVSCCLKAGSPACPAYDSL